jgi:hypothetical protein
MRRRFVLQILFLLLFAGWLSPTLAEAQRRKSRPKRKSVIELVFEKHPELRGVEGESLPIQNEIANKHNLPRIKTNCELIAFVESGYLVRVPNKVEYFELAAGIRKTRIVKDKCSPKVKIKEDRRYLAPRALEYLRSDISPRYSERFTRGKKREFLSISSLVRTFEYQKKLGRRNPNARQANCDPEYRCSPHLTGYAFDIRIKGLNKEQILWLADALAHDVSAGKIFVIFEPNQKNFHVLVIPQKRPNLNRGAFSCPKGGLGLNGLALSERVEWGIIKGSDILVVSLLNHGQKTQRKT